MNEVIRLNGRRVPGFALGDSSSTILQPGWRYLGIVQTPRGWSANQLNKLLEQNGWTDEATGTEPSLAADGLSLGFTISAVWNGGIEPMPSQVDPFVQDVIYVPPFETWDASEEDKGNWTIKSGTSALGEPDTIRQAGENMILLNGKPVRGFGVGEQFPANVTIAAQAAATTLNTDPNFCRSVQQPGTPANVALQAFKLAWNSMPGKYIPAGIFYDDQAAWALGQVVGTAPVACSEGLQKSPPPNQTDGRDVAPPPSYVPPHPTPVVVKALAAGAVGAIAGAGMSYADTRKVSGSAVSYGAVIGAMGALVATALK